MEINLDYFMTILPKTPYCSDSKGYPIIMPVHEACKRRMIQLNHSSWVKFIVIDLDHCNYHIYKNASFPPPTFCVINRENQHSHLIYLLNIHVNKTNLKSYNFLKAVQRGYTRKLQGDIFFNGCLVKNPYHEHWKTEFNNNTYNLNDLDCFLEKEDKKYFYDRGKNFKIDEIVMGNRHVGFFEIVRRKAYSFVKNFPNAVYKDIFDSVLASYTSLNNEIKVRGIEPLEPSDIISQSRNVAEWAYVHKEEILKKFNSPCRNLIIPNMSITKRKSIGGKYVANKRKESMLQENKKLENLINAEIEKIKEFGEKVNVSNICKKLEITRNKFYRNFKLLNIPDSLDSNIYSLRCTIISDNIEKPIEEEDKFIFTEKYSEESCYKPKLMFSAKNNSSACLRHPSFEKEETELPQCKPQKNNHHTYEKIDELKKSGLFQLAELELKITNVISEIEKRGMYLNQDKLIEESIEATKYVKYISNETGRIHAKFNQFGAATGRITCCNPNLQGVPKGLRQYFTAPEGYKIISCDYSNFEMRIMAHLSQDDALLEDFQNEVDVIGKIVCTLFQLSEDEIRDEHRKLGKSFIYGLIYGRGIKSLANLIGKTISETKKLIAIIFKKYPKLGEWKVTVSRKADNKGFITTESGRILHIDTYNPKDPGRRARQAINSIVQSTGADIFKVALVNLYEGLKPYDAHIINLLHDEVIIESQKEIAKQVFEMTKDFMITAAEIILGNVPMVVRGEISDCWEKS